jgi:hypothetical protein
MPDGTVKELAVEISRGSPWWLAFRDFDGARQRFEARDLFEAFLAMRQSLEARGCQLLCAGARKDAWPSGMSRSMGGGRKAFVVQLGLPAEMDALVDIFAYAEPDVVGTVEEQRAYRRKWIDSLGQRQ